MNDEKTKAQKHRPPVFRQRNRNGISRSSKTAADSAIPVHGTHSPRSFRSERGSFLLCQFRDEKDDHKRGKENRQKTDQKLGNAEGEVDAVRFLR